MSQQAKI